MLLPASLVFNSTFRDLGNSRMSAFARICADLPVAGPHWRPYPAIVRNAPVDWSQAVHGGRMEKRFSKNVLAMSLSCALVVVVASLVGADTPKFSDWSTPENLGPIVNSPFLDQGPFIS